MGNFHSAWVDIDAALGLLTVKRETLYAYVSRGLVRSKPKPGDHRASLYALPDIKHMAAKRRRPRKRAEVAKSTIRWGEPILETRISTVRDGRLIFGLEDACDLAKTYSLEAVAAHHWRHGSESMLRDVANDVARDVAQDDIIPTDGALTRGLIYLGRKAAHAPGLKGRSRHDIGEEAGTILSGFADNFIGTAHDGHIHERLAQAWEVRPEGADQIRRALVLISDHELNASSFAVRVTASTGASLAACALAGLCALSGPLHGRASEKATDYLHGALESAMSPRKLSNYMTKNPHIPGLGHPLYPDGDVRAHDLFQAVKPPDRVLTSIKAFEAFSGRRANIDMALASLVLSLNLPRHAGFMIFAIGRMSGWLAHAMEQNESGSLIRPRASFVEG